MLVIGHLPVLWRRRRPRGGAGPRRPDSGAPATRDGAHDAERRRPGTPGARAVPGTIPFPCRYPDWRDQLRRVCRRTSGEVNAAVHAGPRRGSGTAGRDAPPKRPARGPADRPPDPALILRALSHRAAHRHC